MDIYLDLIDVLKKLDDNSLLKVLIAYGACFFFLSDFKDKENEYFS